MTCRRVGAAFVSLFSQMNEKVIERLLDGLAPVLKRACLRERLIGELLEVPRSLMGSGQAQLVFDFFFVALGFRSRLKVMCRLKWSRAAFLKRAESYDPGSSSSSFVDDVYKDALHTPSIPRASR